MECVTLQLVPALLLHMGCDVARRVVLLGASSMMRPKYLFPPEVCLPFQSTSLSVGHAEAEDCTMHSSDSRCTCTLQAVPACRPCHFAIASQHC